MAGVCDVACFHPLPAWKFRRLRELMVAGKPIPTEFPCGRCIGCKSSRQRAWALRITHEASLHSQNCFITLTYNDSCVPPALDYRDFKAFLRRLVARDGPTRYFAAGEYGSKTARPHWHAILFGRSFPVTARLSDTLGASESLQSLWPQGFASVGSVTPRSAAYVAKYALKTEGLAHMSLRPGIGAEWYQRYWPEVHLARDAVVQQGGFHARPPRYYDTLLERQNPSLRDTLRYLRVNSAFAHRGDSTPSRLLDRERCALANQKRLREQL